MVILSGTNPEAPMSALPPKADIGTQPPDVRFVPFPDILRSNEKTLFEHFIDTGEPAHSI
jgi:hypothetical protein